jgi:pantoate--beta-alanine ligase
MEIVYTAEALESRLSDVRDSGTTIGFVPTMGALHTGHMSLINRSLSECGFTVCSIFVNPVQFNDPGDFDKYPRTEEADLQMLEKEGCDLVFLPTVREVFPEPVTKVYDLGGLDSLMEGQGRPGHFQGVAKVVHRLFDMTKPDKAFFGMKDFQQLAIIKYLTRNLNLSIEIVPCATLREPDGLAMSSRNMRLGAPERKSATVIFNALLKAKDLIQVRTPELASADLEVLINRSPFMKTEYVSFVDTYTLKPVIAFEDHNSITCCIAAFCGQIRLIDNYQVRE